MSLIPASKRHRGRAEALRFINSSPLVLGLILVLTLAYGAPVKLNLPLDSSLDHQRNYMNPDAKLYYGLARNLVEGRGYHDTIRDNQDLPSIGHPWLLAQLSVRAGLTPARLSQYSLVLAAAALVLAARIHCRSNLAALAALLLNALLMMRVRWLAGNVESTIALTLALLILCLAGFRRWGFNPWWAIAAGTALAAQILVRPLYLYPTHACLALLLIWLTHHSLRRRTRPLPAALRGWLLLLLTAEALVGVTQLRSQLDYGDSRLVSGTYGAWPLWVANNVHVPGDEPFIGRQEDYPEGYQRMKAIQSSNRDWRQRHRLMMSATFEYWRQHPWRALRCWAWRAQRFLGLHADMFGDERYRRRLRLYGSWRHSATVALLLTLLVHRLWRILRERDLDSLTPPSPGLLVATLYGCYVAMHALFVYVEFRYVTPTIPLLVGSVVFLACELTGWGGGPTTPDQETPREQGAGIQEADRSGSS